MGEPAFSNEQVVEFIKKEDHVAEMGVNLDLRVSCSTCVGACCLKGVSAYLSEAEAAYLQNAGTLLEKSDNMKNRGFGSHKRSMYLFKSDCANLVEEESTGQKLCAIHEDPQRPKICSEFPVGSYACRLFRAKNNVQPGERDNFSIWLDITSAS